MAEYDDEWMRNRAAGRTGFFDGIVDTVGAMAQLAAVGGLLLLVLGGSCYMKKWEYDECLAVGHGETYCEAQAAGCFDGGSGSSSRRR